MMDKSNNFVLYFEVDDITELEAKIIRNGFEFIHKIREQPWKQRVFRFYDYDHHIIEVAERMEEVFYRLYKEDKTIEEITTRIGISADEVLEQIDKYEEMG